MKDFSELESLCDDKFVGCLRSYVRNFEFIEWIRVNTHGMNLISNQPLKISLKILSEI